MGRRKKVTETLQLVEKTLEQRSELVIPQVALPPAPSPLGKTGLEFVAESVGGRETFINYLRLVPDDNVQNMVRWYDREVLANPEKVQSLEELAKVCKVDPIQLVGMVASTLYAYGLGIAKILNAAAQPEIMRASIVAAKDPDVEVALEDRKLQFKMSGLIQEDFKPLVNINLTKGGVENMEDLFKDAIDVQ